MNPLMLMMGAGAGMSAVTGVVSGLIGSAAARRAEGAALGQFDLAQNTMQNNLLNVQDLFRPYITAGANTLGILQGRMFSSTERSVQKAQERNAMENEVAKLSKPTDWNTFPILTGEMASERRAALFTETEYRRKQKLQQAKLRLEQYTTQEAELAPVYEKQDQETAARMNRISTSLDKIARLSDLPTSLADIRGELENDPVFKFRMAEGERAINRAASARGQFFSGAAIGSLADFSMKLTGEETDKFIDRRTVALQSAVTGLQAELGEQGQLVEQSMGLANLGLTAAGAESTATTGIATNQANISMKSGEIAAQTKLAQGNAWIQGLGGVASSLGGLSTLALLTQPRVTETPKEPTMGGGGSTPARRANPLYDSAYGTPGRYGSTSGF